MYYLTQDAAIILRKTKFANTADYTYISDIAWV